MSPSVYLGATGFSLIAVCYGFARFAFGLFLPQIDADLPLSSTLAGLISGGSFLGYCIAIVLAAHLTERAGARAVALGAAAVAAIGMLGVAFAPSSPWLAISVMLAGSSTGLASPPMAAAVNFLIKPDRQNATNTVINAGTSAGVALSGPVALIMGGQWRIAFAIFAGAALVTAAAVAFSVPNQTKTNTKIHSILPLSGTLKRLIAASFLMGASSTAIWSFGSQLVALRLGWSSTGAGLLWVYITDLTNYPAGAGILIARLGISRVHWISLMAMAAGILFVGTGITTPFWTVAGGVLFGAAYIMLTGVYLVWGVSAMPDRPATGLMVGFLTLAIGQTVGAPVFGLLVDWLTTDHAVIVFACLTLIAGLLRPGTP